jgi:hypothetical protein
MLTRDWRGSRRGTGWERFSNMYVSARGLGATSRLTRFQAGVLARAKRARGLRGFGALNCPGDPGCPGYVAPTNMNCPGDPGCPGYVAPVGSDYTYTGGGSSFVAPSTGTGSSFISWLNANAKTVGIAAAVGFGVLMLSGGRGRR